MGEDIVEKVLGATVGGQQSRNIVVRGDLIRGTT